MSKTQKIISLSVFVFLTFFSAILLSNEGVYIGKVGSINAANKEIIVNIEGDKTVKMGDHF